MMGQWPSKDQGPCSAPVSRQQSAGGVLPSVWLTFPKHVAARARMWVSEVGMEVALAVGRPPVAHGFLSQGGPL